jgi:hypothetical protein
MRSRVAIPLGWRGDLTFFLGAFDENLFAVRRLHQSDLFNCRRECHHWRRHGYGKKQKRARQLSEQLHGSSLDRRGGDRSGEFVAFVFKAQVARHHV